MLLDYLPYMMMGGSAVLTHYPLYFILFVLINTGLNIILKHQIRQGRPKTCPVYLKESYGMPSGHSQTASFSAAFVWQEVSLNQKMILGMLTLVTMAQRVYTDCHTVAQVLAGFLVGAVLGVSGYRISRLLPRLSL